MHKLPSLLDEKEIVLENFESLKPIKGGNFD